MSADPAWPAADPADLEDAFRASLNILADLSDEQAFSAQVERALLNLLDDSAAERAMLEATQRGILNILDDFDLERQKSERAYRELTREMAGRKAAEDALRAAMAETEAARADLEVANRELESFSYSVAHDLRAPLRAIDGFARILVEDHGPQLDEEARRVLGVVVTNVGRMGELIDGLLAFSRLGRAGLTLADVDMDTLAHDVAAELQAADPRPVTVEIRPLGRVRCDPTMLRQVWANLLANARKFSRDRSPALVVVERRDEADEPTFAVRDNGVGFDMQYAAKLFEMFQRLHPASAFEGTGIGLALVRRVVERHGGRVWAEGEVERGATFTFTLPRGG